MKWGMINKLLTSHLSDCPPILSYGGWHDLNAIRRVSSNHDHGYPRVENFQYACVKFFTWYSTVVASCNNFWAIAHAMPCTLGACGS